MKNDTVVWFLACLLVIGATILFIGLKELRDMDREAKNFIAKCEDNGGMVTIYETCVEPVRVIEIKEH